METAKEIMNPPKLYLIDETTPNSALMRPMHGGIQMGLLSTGNSPLSKR
jgi:hypothetical protein